ncbi:FecR family protein [Sphingopyxis granuli]|uniref:Anti-FecI sigma factor, FecR n=1 Tax=Sphingopyxis granuli TaxID=267128 RepID=A0AA86GKM9_9SPHN|nr:FecR domain-containing protein [Sphingopyxis granuli]AMG74607.1 Anti-FecI sigma factor, FecR [Sphingopyxis granuli]
MTGLSMIDHNGIDDDADRWALWLEEGQPDADRQAAFDAWLAADPRHAGALLRAEALLTYIDRGRVLASARDYPAPDAKPRIGRRAMLAGGGSLAAAGLAFVLFRPGGVAIETTVGEVRKVALADGSIAAVNTDSKVEVAIDDKARTVDLERGEAWFQVAHDKQRPFVVAAGAVRVRAVGTAFSVRRHPRGVDVLVTEGVVETWVEGRTGDVTRIAAGSKGFVAEATPTAEVVEAPADVVRALAWRTGMLALNGESLAFAVNELNRYNVRKLVVADDELGRKSLIGYFKIDQPENFGRAVAKMIDARVEVDEDVIRIRR